MCAVAFGTSMEVALIPMFQSRGQDIGGLNSLVISAVTNKMKRYSDRSDGKC